jgi:hypothetical protein
VAVPAVLAPVVLADTLVAPEREPIETAAFAAPQPEVTPPAQAEVAPVQAFDTAPERTPPMQAPPVEMIETAQPWQDTSTPPVGDEQPPAWTAPVVDAPPAIDAPSAAWQAPVESIETVEPVEPRASTAPSPWVQVETGASPPHRETRDAQQG